MLQMILQGTNFNVPARFTFQPYSARWRFVSAEILEWAAESQLGEMSALLNDEPGRTWLRVGIGESLYGTLGGLYGTDVSLSCTIRMDRASVPPDVLQPHENSDNTPDISGRSFTALICQKPEFKDGPWVKPEESTKNAWYMRDEFLNLDAETEWEWSVWQFLNKWGIWQPSLGFSPDWTEGAIRRTGLLPSIPMREIVKTDFMLVMPHLLKEEQTKFRRALLPSHSRSWLRSHPFSLDTAEEFPFFRLRRSYCRDAIEATITIDHLSDNKFGICKRCHKVFEKEKNYKMSYCGRSCANAASVARFREKQRKAKPNWTAAKIAKVLRQQKEAKRDAKG